MRQLTFIKPGCFEWREVPAPALTNDREALVRPLAVTRCDLDLYIATGLFPMAGPFAFGHEIAGEIVSLGDDVRGFTTGDRVIVPFQINCGECRQCRRGFTNACEAVPPYSAYGLAPSSGHDWGGGLSDLVRVPFAQAMLVKVPDHFSLQDAAALSDNAADGYRTVARPLEENPGAEVLVVGGLAQSVGLYAVQAAIALGAGRVVYTDFSERRLAIAKRMGAQVNAINYDKEPSVTERFDIVVEAAGLPQALAFALRSTAPCGICTGVSAGTGNNCEIPLRAMYMDGITYQVSRVHARSTLDQISTCAHCSGFHPERLIEEAVPFSDAADAMDSTAPKIVFLADQI